MTTKSVPKILDVVKRTTLGTNGGFKKMLMEHLGQKQQLLSIPIESPHNVASVGGDRSYMLVGSYAKLEQALYTWTLNELVSKYKFTPVTVPNILHDHIIEKCGFKTKSDRSQVYKISGNNRESILDETSATSEDDRTHSCIAGTSEFALASIHIGDSIPSQELPKRYCALSRCYRAENSRSGSEWGLYRVHYFNKVEMFAFTMPSQSHAMHQEFLGIQRDLFDQLGLSYRVLDMPEDDLGLSAKRKFDIEAWMAGREKFGEISSTSNCEEYQTSRLGIKYTDFSERDGQLVIDNGFVHTVNGTACSTIRTMLAIVEQNQTDKGEIVIPEVLVKHMSGARVIPTDNDKKLLKEVNLYP